MTRYGSFWKGLNFNSLISLFAYHEKRTKKNQKSIILYREFYKIGGNITHK